MSEPNEIMVRQEVVAEESANLDKPVEVDPHQDRTKEFRTPGFHRMRTDWHGPDGDVVRQVHHVVDGLILREFADAYAIMNDLYGIVREQAYDVATGVLLTDQFGWPVWKRNEDGTYIEDYSNLTIREREDMLFKITTRLFDWEQRAADAWAQAMYAKAAFEERFSLGYTEAGGRKTVEDRTQAGRIYSVEERYFAVFKSHYSRRADAIVKSMERIGQRIKDTLTS